MSDVHIFTPENRLGKILNSLGGATPGEMVAEAEKRVEALTDTIQTFVAAKVQLILAYGDHSDEELFAECGTLADAAVQVAEVAAAAKLGAVGEITRGIANIVDELLTLGVWHGEALRVHIRALQLVTQTQGRSAIDNGAVADRLREMRISIGLSE